MEIQLKYQSDIDLTKYADCLGNNVKATLGTIAKRIARTAASKYMTSGSSPDIVGIKTGRLQANVLSSAIGGANTTLTIAEDGGGWKLRQSSDLVYSGIQEAKKPFMARALNDELDPATELLEKAQIKAIEDCGV